MPRLQGGRQCRTREAACLRRAPAALSPTPHGPGRVRRLFIHKQIQSFRWFAFIPLPPTNQLSPAESVSVWKKNRTSQLLPLPLWFPLSRSCCSPCAEPGRCLPAGQESRGGKPSRCQAHAPYTAAAIEWPFHDMAVLSTVSRWDLVGQAGGSSRTQCRKKDPGLSGAKGPVARATPPPTQPLSHMNARGAALA